MSTISASTTSTTAYKVTADTTGTLVLQTGSTPTTAVTIDGSQNVGIGTASPSYRLDVQQSQNAASLVGITNSNAGTAAQSVYGLFNGTATGQMALLGSSFTTAGVVRQNGLYISNNGAGGVTLNTGAAQPIYFSINNAEAGRFDASGNFLVGATSPGAGFAGPQLVVGKSANPYGVIEVQGSNTSDGAIGRLHFYNTVGAAVLGWIACERSGSNSSGALTFNTTSSGTGAEAMRINSGGNLLIGTTGSVMSGGGKIEIRGDFYNGNVGIALSTSNDTTGALYAQFGNSAGTRIGSITRSGTSTVAYNTSSDYRLKENIQPMTGALAKVQTLKPVTYQWKEDGSNGEGFIAHELAEVVPQCVTGIKDAVETYTDEEGNEQTRPVYQGIDTSFLVATLTAAIQEQQAIIETLTNRITALEAK